MCLASSRIRDQLREQSERRRLLGRATAPRASLGWDDIFRAFRKASLGGVGGRRSSAGTMFSFCVFSNTVRIPRGNKRTLRIPPTERRTSESYHTSSACRRGSQYSRLHAATTLPPSRTNGVCGIHARVALRHAYTAHTSPAQLAKKEEASCRAEHQPKKK